MYEYPYGDSQQLNLDWIISKLKELESSSGSGSGGADLEEVAEALITLKYNPTTAYRRYDYCWYNDKLYRCITDTTGAFNAADWMETLIGIDLPVITRLMNADNAAITTLQGQVSTLQNDVGSLDSDDVSNASDVTGTTVSNALETLKDSINTVNSSLSTIPSAHYATMDANNVSTGSVTARRYLKTIIVSGNVTMKSGGIGAWLQPIMTLSSNELPSSSSDIWAYGHYDGNEQWIKCEVLTDGTVRTRVTSSGTHSITDLQFPNSVIFG